MAKKRAKPQANRLWYKIDLHLHTPASADYQENSVNYLDILKQAELRGLDIIAFTDHNTVKGYSTMLEEIDLLGFLEHLGRAVPDEVRRLSEYRRLLDKILVLPGFEFTATFGFHILGIFPPHTPVRQLEHILLSLNVPSSTLDEGSSNVGASADVLTAYRMIEQSGGLAIAAHANSAHGVAMRGLDFGGQTRIAYTQDPHLHALEVTDLEKRGRNTTARFFDGTKPGYPRRMHCIQGSDAHRLTAPNPKSKDLGIGDRVTEISLYEPSFEGLRGVFESRDFSLTRPYRSTHAPVDYIQTAREEGESISQAFYPTMEGANHLSDIIADICAFANTTGGTVYIGVSSNPKEAPMGVAKVSSSIELLYAEVDNHISPKLDVEIDAQTTQQKAVILVQVSRGDHPPYAVDDHKIYVRDEAETTLAVRDEIVRLVQRAAPHFARENQPEAEKRGDTAVLDAPPPLSSTETDPPLTGVEVVSTEKRRGTLYHNMRDLRNGNLIQNVTRSSARRLWHYAITQTEDKTFDENAVLWNGSVGLIRRYKKVGTVRYDLAQHVVDPDGNERIRIYYGVTEDGMHGAWTAFISEEEVPEES